MLYDTHCHLYKEYYDDVNEIVEKAANNKICCSILGNFKFQSFKNSECSSR